jgi:hypothetical protein
VPTTLRGSILYAIVAIWLGLLLLCFSPGGHEWSSWDVLSTGNYVWVPHLLGVFLLVWAVVWLYIVLNKRDWPASS